MPQKLPRAKTRRAKRHRALTQLQADQQQPTAAAKAHVRQDVIPTDPDAVWVKKHGRIIPGYNAHAAVDRPVGMVVAVKPVAAANAREELNPLLDRVRRTAGAPAETAVIDNGYDTDEAIVPAADGPTRCLIPDGPAARSLNQGQAPQPAAADHCRCRCGVARCWGKPPRTGRCRPLRSIRR